MEKAWFIQNNGAGAVRLKRIRFVDRRTGQCIDSEKSRDWKLNQNTFLKTTIMDIQGTILDKFATQINSSETLKRQYGPVYNPQADLRLIRDFEILDIAEIIAPGKTRYVLKISTEYRESSFKLSEKFGFYDNVEEVVTQSFSSSIANRDLKIDYCSISGDNCEEASGGGDFRHCHS